MVGKLIKTVYRYEDVTLGDAKIAAYDVTIENGKVVSIPNGTATVVVDGNDRSFNFGLYSFGINGELTYNIANVPVSVDGQAIVKEFVDFVEKDIA